jgi:hypothetical protein
LQVDLPYPVAGALDVASRLAIPIPWLGLSTLQVDLPYPVAGALDVASRLAIPTCVRAFDACEM